jgi:hypothetical protein
VVHDASCHRKPAPIARSGVRAQARSPAQNCGYSGSRRSFRRVIRQSLVDEPGARDRQLFAGFVRKDFGSHRAPDGPLDVCLNCRSQFIEGVLSECDPCRRSSLDLARQCRYEFEKETSHPHRLLMGEHDGGIGDCELQHAISIAVRDLSRQAVDEGQKIDYCRSVVLRCGLAVAVPASEVRFQKWRIVLESDTGRHGQCLTAGLCVALVDLCAPGVPTDGIGVVVARSERRASGFKRWSFPLHRCNSQ